MQQRAYRAANKEKIKAYNQRYYRERKQERMGGTSGCVGRGNGDGIAVNYPALKDWVFPLHPLHPL
jgi:hypothetical protein